MTRAMTMTRSPLLLLLLSGCFVPQPGGSDDDASGEVSDPPVTVAWAQSTDDQGCLDLEITSEEALDEWSLALKFATPPDALISATGLKADLSAGDVVLTPETKGFLAATGQVNGTICLSPRTGPTDLSADVSTSTAGKFGTLQDSGQVLGLIYRVGSGGCVDLEVVNLTGEEIVGWELEVHLDTPTVLQSASGDGIHTFVGDTTSDLLLYPTSTTNKLGARASALGQVCLKPASVPDHITTSWESGP